MIKEGTVILLFLLFIVIGSYIGDESFYWLNRYYEKRKTESTTDFNENTLKWKMFEMKSEVYDVSSFVIITEDTLKAMMFLRGFLGDTSIIYRDFNVRGIVFNNKNHPPVMWIPRLPVTSEDKGIVAHEMFHLVTCIMNYVDIPLDTSSEEAYAYMYSHLSQQFWENIEKLQQSETIRK